MAIRPSPLRRRTTRTLPCTLVVLDLLALALLLSRLVEVLMKQQQPDSTQPVGLPHLVRDALVLALRLVALVAVVVVAVDRSSEQSLPSMISAI